MMLYHRPVVLEARILFGHLLIMNMIWNVNIFSKYGSGVSG